MADSGEPGKREDIEGTIESLEERINRLEDQVMMERLEDLAIEDEIEVIERVLGVDIVDIRDKLDLLDEIEEEREEIGSTELEEVNRKLDYLYGKMKSMEGGGEERLEDIEEKLSSMEPEEGRSLDDAYDKLFKIRDRLREMDSLPAEEIKEKISSLDRRVEELEKEDEKAVEQLQAGKEITGEVVERVTRERESEDIGGEQLLQALEYSLEEFDDMVDEVVNRIEELRMDVEEGLGAGPVDESHIDDLLDIAKINRRRIENIRVEVLERLEDLEGKNPTVVE